MARKLGDLGIVKPDDLLAHLPRDYKDWRYPPPIATLQADGSEVIAVGKIGHVTERRARLPLVTAQISDESGSLIAKWFGRRHLFGVFRPGQWIFVSGRLNRGRLFPELNVTAHRLLRDGEYRGEIVPVYPATAELPSRALRALIAKNLERLIAQRRDVMPPQILQRFRFPPLHEAWREVHAPTLDLRGIFRDRIGRCAETRAARSARRSTAASDRRRGDRPVRSLPSLRPHRGPASGDRRDPPGHAPDESDEQAAAR